MVIFSNCAFFLNIKRISDPLKLLLVKSTAPTSIAYNFVFSKFSPIKDNPVRYNN